MKLMLTSGGVTNPSIEAALVALGLLVLAISGIDTGGRLPHPQPLPAPSAPSFSGS